MEFQINQTLTKINGNVVFEIAEKFDSVSNFISYKEQITGLSNNNRIKREFCWSNANSEWSLWTPLNDVNLSQIDWKTGIFLKLRYTAYEKYDTRNITIDSIELNFKESEENSGATKPEVYPYISDFPNLAKNFFDSINKMNEFIAKSYGLLINYLSVEPDIETDDVILGEFSLQHVSDQKCIHIVIQDNNIPNNKFDFFEFGMDYENFEVYILKSEFKNIFGKDKHPRVDDILFLPQVNRCYYVASVKVDNTVDNLDSAYVLYLKDYVDNKSVDKKGEVKQFLDSKIVTYQELFGEKMESEIRNQANSQQNSMKTIADDINRFHISQNMKIFIGEYSNNGTTLFNSFYDLTEIEYNTNAITYKHKHSLDLNSSWAYTCLFKIPNVIRDSSYSLQARIIDENRIDFYTVEITVDKNLALINKGSIMINAEYYDIADIKNDGMTFTVIATGSMIGKPVKKVVKSNFLISGSIKCSMYDFKFIRLANGTQYYQFALDSVLIPDEWYGFVLNLSNIHKYVSFYIWKQINRQGTDDRLSSRLDMIEKRELPMQSAILISDETPGIDGSMIHLANIRILSKAIPQEYQSIFLSTRILRQPSLAYVIDDAEPVHNIPTIGDGQTLITEIDQKYSDK